MIEFEKYVMSLDKFKNRKPVFVFQLDENGDYDNRDVYDLHHAWIASAQREGYKLVPLEMHWHKADDLASAEWDKHKSLFCSDNRDMTAIQVEDFRLRWCKIKANKIMSEYKAIIGAAE